MLDSCNVMSLSAPEGKTIGDLGSRYRPVLIVAALNPCLSENIPVSAALPYRHLSLHFHSNQ